MLGPGLPGVPLGAAAARCLLALCDDDTPVWFQHDQWQHDDATLVTWLCFHTGAPRSPTPDAARFGVITRALAMPSLSAFHMGVAESPEQSTTLLIELPSFDTGSALEWRGPGIREAQAVALAGLPAAFWSQWQTNHAAYPQGVDVLFTCGDQLIGLPRTTRVRRLERV